ncbi:MAG TPA: hypothetical protein VM032_15895, partial [Vicinamibacterales bacterium]|nr:hypothetical protein [Vicinamibacterales bacterium]
GRADDCVRTRDGRLVNLEVVAAGLRGAPGVGAAVVVPLAGAAGTAFGAVLQMDAVGSLASVRESIAATLPGWALPRAITVVRELPRLPNGKPDRLACLGLLSSDEGASS